MLNRRQRWRSVSRPSHIWRSGGLVQVAASKSTSFQVASNNSPLRHMVSKMNFTASFSVGKVPRVSSAEKNRWISLGVKARSLVLTPTQN
jgi:hypothetical protein